MTQLGMILGTAAYMSPEQAKGRQADKRSDVWAFGAVLYEMLSGQRAFKGDDVADTLAAVLRQDIDWTALPASTPASVRRLLARCLDRDVESAAARHRRSADRAGRSRRARHRRRGTARPPSRRRGPCGDARFRSCSPRSWPVHWSERRVVPQPQAPDAARGDSISVHAAGRTDFTTPSGNRHMVALSPDGAQMVYAANTRLYLRSMSELDAQAIQGTEGYRLVTEPVFSPDGRSIAFYAVADQTLKRIAITGGAAVTICPADNPFGISWGPDGIVFGQGSKGIMRVSPNGGTPDVLVRVKDGEDGAWPAGAAGRAARAVHARDRHRS